MFIDIHSHAYRRPIPFVVRFPNAEELIAQWDKAGIERGFVLPVVSNEIYLPQSNEDILEMCENHPDRLMPFCNVDPRALTDAWDAPLDTVLSYYKDKGCRGVGEIMPNLRMDNPMVQNLFKCAEIVGLPVTTDGSDREWGDFGLYDDPGLPQLEHTLQRFPKLQYIAHGPIFWNELVPLQTCGMRKSAFRPNGEQVFSFLPKGPFEREGVVFTLFRRYGNLTGELSDAAAILDCDHDFAGKFLNEFQDRLFFGTDTCCLNMPYNSRKLLLALRDEKKITEQVFQKIARENAIRFFKI